MRDHLSLARPLAIVSRLNFEKRAEIPTTTSGHLQQLHALITCNGVQRYCFPFGVLVVFAMLPAHGIWR